LCTLVLAVAILRHRLLDSQAPVRTFFFVLLLTASAGVVVALVTLRLPERVRPGFVFGAVALTTLLTLYRTLFIRLYEQAGPRHRLVRSGAQCGGSAARCVRSSGPWPRAWPTRSETRSRRSRAPRSSCRRTWRRPRARRR